MTSLDPSAKFSSHDKIEGVAQLNGDRTIILSNDSDFGINELTQNATVPFTPHVKVSPTTGRQDKGEFLAVDMPRRPAGTSTAVVTLRVR